MRTGFGGMREREDKLKKKKVWSIPFDTYMFGVIGFYFSNKEGKCRHIKIM